MPPSSPPCIELGIFDMFTARVPWGSANTLSGWSPRSTSSSVIRISALLPSAKLTVPARLSRLRRTARG